MTNCYNIPIKSKSKNNYSSLTKYRKYHKSHVIITEQSRIPKLLHKHTKETRQHINSITYPLHQRVRTTAH